MCGIIISDLKIPITAYKFVKNRGPDETNEVSYNGINFVHFLLHLTGERTLQPIISEDIICIFNGEIYNYKEIFPNAKSDVESILYAYKREGVSCIKRFDGEFAIIIFDFKNMELIISSDIFHTKPIFYDIGDNIVIASYESTCQSIKRGNYTSIRPNEILVFDLETKNIKNKLTICEFDLEQKKNNYEDYIVAFEKSVLKRYPENSIPLITLSSGLDSGAISCCLNKYKKEAIHISILKNEYLPVIENRAKQLHPNHKIVNLTDKDRGIYKKYLENNCESFVWDWRYHKTLNHIDNGFNMGSMLGKSKIITNTKTSNPDIRVLFSGIGADEIMAHNSYYSCGWGNVNFFPDDLTTVYPWVNFYGGSMNNYLKGDEYVGGCFGYETRYPFCDKNVVQEFLWLKPALKNNFNGSNYKPALLYYLSKEKFPFHLRKLGFNV